MAIYVNYNKPGDTGMSQKKMKNRKEAKAFSVAMRLKGYNTAIIHIKE